MEPKFFATREELRAWFEDHGEVEKELWIGYYKRGSGRTSVPYQEVVFEALCFGWIDGQVRRIDAQSYANRYTPRGPKSPWSLINVGHVERLIREGRMRPPGQRAFDARLPHRTGIYAYEQARRTPETLDATARAQFRAAGAAFGFFRQQPPGYRRTMEGWVMAARQPETRTRRLAALIEASRAQRRVDPLRPYSRTLPAPARRVPRTKRRSPRR
jgi:uncharacterized protein YdeI (YjbR/CyaY-like superfamily)